MSIRIAVFILCAGSLVGCKQQAATTNTATTSATAPAAPTAGATIETVAFAPELGVDLKVMTKTASGLYYRDVTIGSGAVADTAHAALVHYVGALPNGSVFDSNGPNDSPFEFRPGQGEVIRGWDEGVAGMRVGGRRQLVLPPELGYGANGAGPIPPNSILVFTVDLVAVQ